MNGKVKMDKTAWEQFLSIRDSGATNMFDFNMVQRLAYEQDYYELVNWMEEHRNEYSNLIFYGAEVDTEDEESNEEEVDEDE